MEGKEITFRNGAGAGWFPELNFTRIELLQYFPCRKEVFVSFPPLSFRVTCGKQCVALLFSSSFSRYRR